MGSIAFAGGSNQPTDPSVNQDMGGPDFGLSNPNSWDDSTSSSDQQTSTVEQRQFTANPYGNISNPTNQTNQGHSNGSNNSPTIDSVHLQKINVDTAIEPSSVPDLNLESDQAQKSKDNQPTVGNQHNDQLFSAGQQNTGDQSGGTSSNSSAEHQALEAEQYQCSQAQSIAYQDCVNQNVNTGAANGARQESATQVLQDALNATATTSGSVSALCGQMKNASNVATALDAYLASQCQMAVSQCESVCRDGGYAIATCRQYATFGATMKTQAMESQLAAKIASDCQTKTEAVAIAQNSVTHAANSASGGMSGELAATTSRNITAGNPCDQSVQATRDQAQIPPIRNASPTKANLAQVPAAATGSANLPQPLSAGRGSVQAAPSAPTSKGWNTHVMQGLSSGNGYSPSSGGVVGQIANSTYQGSSDWPNSSFGGPTQYGRAINLQKFLPTVPSHLADGGFRPEILT